MTSIASTIERIDLFQATSQDQLAAISSAAERRIFQPGDVLIARDETCDAAILVIEGDAVVLRGENDAPLEDPIKPGSLIAEMAMVVDIVASSTIVARGRVKAVQFPRSAILSLIEDDPTLAEALIQSITSRLWTVADRLREIDAGLARSSDGTLHDDGGITDYRRYENGSAKPGESLARSLH